MTISIDQVICADSEEYLPTLPSDSVDLVLTDPPYGISFMGKDWDKFGTIHNLSTDESADDVFVQKNFKKLPRQSSASIREFFVPIWKECLRILKPGGFAFVMAIPRADCMWRQAAALEEAGFDVSFSPIQWIYRQGFPKAGDISKDFDKAAFSAWLKSVDHGLSKADFRKVLSAAVGGVYNSPSANGASYMNYAGNNPRPWREGCKTDEATRLLASVVARHWEPLTELERLDIWKEHSNAALREYQKQTLAIGPDHQDLTLPPGVRVKVGESTGRQTIVEGRGQTIHQEGGDLGPEPNITAPSVDLARQYAGIKSASGLKPAFEFCLMAQKPRVSGPIRKNVEQYGVGGINVKAAAMPHSESIKLTQRKSRSDGGSQVFTDQSSGFRSENTTSASPALEGRFPANIICSDQALGEEGSKYFDLDRWATEHGYDAEWLEAARAGCVQVAKPSKREKDNGLSGPLQPRQGCRPNTPDDGSLYQGKFPKHDYRVITRNNHPTCKPVKLMAWLIALGCPPGGTVLDPFAGSGTTGVAAVKQGCHYICVDSDRHYCDIAEARIEAARRSTGLSLF